MWSKRDRLNISWPDTEETVMREELKQKELWTQKEVADYFRVSCNTIKNWRERGLLSCFKAPGSSRILYYSQEVVEFQEQFTTRRKEANKGQKRIERARPRLSSEENWRIS
jgi:hypothetical protein